MLPAPGDVAAGAIEQLKGGFSVGACVSSKFSVGTCVLKSNPREGRGGAPNWNPVGAEVARDLGDKPVVFNPATGGCVGGCAGSCAVVIDAPWNAGAWNLVVVVVSWWNAAEAPDTICSIEAAVESGNCDASA